MDITIFRCELDFGMSIFVKANNLHPFTSLCLNGFSIFFQ